MITVPIEEAFEAMLSMLSESFRGSPPNVAEENLQTRIRGNILMGLSNKFGWVGTHHRQQERDGHGLRHPLRRHGGRVCRNQGRAQDPGL